MEENVNRPLIGELLKTSWATTKKYVWELIGIVITYSIIILLVNLIFGNFSFSQTYSIKSVIGSIVILFVEIVFMAGYTRILLDATEGKEVKFSSFKTEFPKIGKLFLADLVFGVLIIVGLLLLVIPGIWILLRLMFFPYFIIGENCGPIEALKKSWNITKRNDGYLFLFILTAILLMIIGLICLIVGVFVTSVVLALASTYLYKSLKLRLQDQ